jgi:hypothetical protein
LPEFFSIAIRAKTPLQPKQIAGISLVDFGKDSHGNVLILSCEADQNRSFKKHLPETKGRIG